jgi:hypothetical protein
MSIRGPEALASLDEAMRDIRREEEDIAKRVAKSSEKISKIKEHEAELFRQLALLRLDPKVQAELDGRISTAEARARDKLKSYTKTLSATEREIAETDALLATLAADRAEALKEYERQQSELKALATRLGASIAKDPEFAAKRAQATEMAEIANQSMRKTEQAEADRDAKGKPYRDDALFMYLWEAGYGTAAYRANNLVRYFDSLVANLIRFHKARPNFAMLNEIPLRLREHAERQIELARQAEDELDVLEEAAIDKAGGKPMRDEMAKIQSQIDARDQQILAAEDRRDELARSLGQMSQGNSTVDAALNELATALGREDIQTLLAEARLTRTGQDDTIVAQIDEARARAKSEDAEQRELNDRLKVLSTRRRELEDIQWEFKKQRFDDPRSMFREDKLVGDMMTDFLRGAISAATYWESWRKSQNWSAGTSDWGGGIGLPNNGRQTNRTPWGPQGGQTFHGQIPALAVDRTSPRVAAADLAAAGAEALRGAADFPARVPDRPERASTQDLRRAAGFKPAVGVFS